MNRNQLTCIDLDQPTLEGFRKFLSAWLYCGERETFVVDPGPLSTIPLLLEELKRSGVERLDTIYLTHIHIDHAGGTGALLETYPQAKVVCHPDGVRHMAAPEKLWQGSLKVLGKTAEAYGEIIAVPQESLVAAQEGEAATPGGMQCYLTPGHAVHHCCYRCDELLFAGEVAGVHFPHEQEIYMRPATPPRFMLETALASLERMMALQPQAAVIAHYGLVEPALKYLQIGQRQFKLWVAGVAAISGLPAEQREQAFFDWLLEHDPHFRLIKQLDSDIYARERIFFGNTFAGMSDYVERLSAEERSAVSRLPE
ncbi:MAG: MBL fold metallo-hydrolase [Desulfuromonas sp.]|nr:MAG: MBL fold metallo-hydrolase [Desulfuromonas sp.]